MARACIASINLEAIKRNYLYAKSLAPNSQAIAIVKADAYGHGAVEVTTHLEDTVDAFGVACTEEAIEIREVGLEKKPILLLEGMFEKSELELLEKYKLLPVIGNKSQLKWILEAKLKSPTKVFVKYDSGMSRLGFHRDEFKQALKALEASNNVAEIVLMTHFSKADEPYDIATQNQIDNFNRIAKETGHPSSIANSAGIVAWRNSHKQYNRPGIMLYGSSPFTEARYQKNLAPVMTLSSVLISIKNFKKGQGIGYGSRFTCKKDMKIGVVAVGYADGYPRLASNKGYALINGVKAPIVGVVCMDFIMLDVTDCGGVDIDSLVVLIGKQGIQQVTVEDMADWAMTIPYEILCNVSKRSNYKYIGSN